MIESKIEYGDKPGLGLSVAALEKIHEHQGEGWDLQMRETADQKARRYVDNLQSLMHNAFGITLRVYYEAEWEQRCR